MFPDVTKIDVKELSPVERTRCINMITLDEEKGNSEIKITKSNQRMNLLDRKRIKTPRHLSRCLRNENKAALPTTCVYRSILSIQRGSMLHARKKIFQLIGNLGPPLIQTTRATQARARSRAKISVVPVTLGGYTLRTPTKAPGT